MDQPISSDAEGIAQANPEPEQMKAEWLSFRLADLDYAVDILKVREIRIWEPCTRIPYAPDYVDGLINLRGAIVPIPPHKPVSKKSWSCS